MDRRAVARERNAELTLETHARTRETARWRTDPVLSCTTSSSSTSRSAS